MEEPIGILILLGLGILLLLRTITRWRRYRRVEKYGFLIKAQVTDIKRESRLVTQTGGARTTFSKLRYEDFLYAQGQDPQTMRIYMFRVKLQDFYDFRIGEEIPFKVNPENQNEYHIIYSKVTRKR